jgi:hypothetical protein
VHTHPEKPTNEHNQHDLFFGFLKAGRDLNATVKTQAGTTQHDEQQCSRPCASCVTGALSDCAVDAKQCESATQFAILLWDFGKKKKKKKKSWDNPIRYTL